MPPAGKWYRGPSSTACRPHPAPPPSAGTRQSVCANICTPGPGTRKIQGLAAATVGARCYGTGCGVPCLPGSHATASIAALGPPRNFRGVRTSPPRKACLVASGDHRNPAGRGDRRAGSGGQRCRACCSTCGHAGDGDDARNQTDTRETEEEEHSDGAFQKLHSRNNSCVCQAILNLVVLYCSLPNFSRSRQEQLCRTYARQPSIRPDTTSRPIRSFADRRCSCPDRPESGRLCHRIQLAALDHG